MRKRVLCFAMLTVCMLLVVCLSAGAEGAERGLTLMVYMTGSNLESSAVSDPKYRIVSASRDLETMKASVQEDKNTAVVVLAGGTTAWQNGFAADKDCIWQVKPGELALVEEGGQRNMGEAETLSAFLRKAKELFPAERYALIIWDHGGGPLSGVCFDERYNMDGLTLPELSAALANSPFAAKKLSWIGFDACLMASVETACAVAPYAEYMIASQEPETGGSWNYAFLRELADAGDGAAAGETVIRTYEEYKDDSAFPASMSCLDLSRAEAVRGEMDRLFGELADSLTEETWPLIAECRLNSKRIGACSTVNWDLVDLLDLVRSMDRRGAADVSALREEAAGMIVSSWSSEDRENGLSVYAPYDNRDYYSLPWSGNYEKLDFSAGYQQYVQRFARFWLAPCRMDWTDQEAVEARAEENREKQRSLTWDLKDELAENVGSARLLVLETGWGAENECRLIYAGEAVLDDGTLRASYGGEALYLTDGEGRLIDGEPIEPFPLERGLATPALLESASGQESVWLLWQEKENGAYTLGGMETYNSGTGTFTASSRMPRGGDAFKLGSWSRLLPEEGATYRKWPQGKYFIYSPAAYEEGTEWQLEYLPLDSEYSRFAVFEVTDLQGYVHLSKPIGLKNLAETVLEPEEQIREGSGLRVTLKEASLIIGAVPCLKIDLALRLDRQEAEYVYLNTVLLDRTAIPAVQGRVNYPNTSAVFEPGKEYAVQLVLTAADLQQARAWKCSALGLAFAVGTDPVLLTFDFPLDAGLLDPEDPPEMKPVFTGEADGTVFEILSLETDADGDLAGELRLANHSGQDQLWKNTVTARIGGEELYGSPERDALSFILLPDGGEAYCRYKIYTWIWTPDGEQRISVPAPEQLDGMELEFRRQDGSGQAVTVILK